MKPLLTTLTLSGAAAAAIAGPLGLEHVLRLALPDALTLLGATVAGGVSCLAGMAHRTLHVARSA